MVAGLDHHRPCPRVESFGGGGFRVRGGDTGALRGAEQLELVEGPLDHGIGGIRPHRGRDLRTAARERHQPGFIGAEDDVVAAFAHGGGHVGDEAILVLGAFVHQVVAARVT